MDSSKYRPWMDPTFGFGMAIFWAVACGIAHVPLAAPPAIAGAVCVALAVRRAGIGATLFRCACWLAPAGWGVWVAWADLTWISIIVLVSLTLPAIVLSQSLSAARRRVDVVPGAEHPEAQRLRLLLDELILKMVPADGKYLHKVTRFKMWPGKSGYTARVVPPPGWAVTITKARGIAEELESEMWLPEGCDIRFSRADHAGAFSVEVMLVNALVENRSYPTRYRPRTVLDAIPLGWYADGSAWVCNVYQESTVAVAMRGGGKTVLMHDLIAGLVQCKDAIIIVIDMNGAGLAVPWMVDFATGKVDTPPIDFVANGEDAAVAVAAMLIAMALERKSALASLMRDHNTDVIPPSADVVEIEVIVDEGGEIFGAEVTKKKRRAAALLLELQRIGRAVLVNVIFTSQRGTSDYVPAQLKKATWNKFVGPVQDDDEIGHIMGWRYKLHADDLTDAGQWYVQLGKNPPRKAKSYGLLPAQISDIVRAVQAWRPTLDAITARAGGRIWADRWDMMAPWLWSIANPDFDPDDAPVVDVEAILSGDPTPAAEGAARAQEYVTNVRKAIEEVAALAEKAEKWDEVADQHPEDGDEWATTRKQIEEYPVLTEPRNTGAARTVAPPEPDLTTNQAFIVTLLRDAGPAGMETKALYTAAIEAGRAKEGRPATINDILAQLEKRGLAQRIRTGWWAATDQVVGE